MIDLTDLDTKITKTNVEQFLTEQLGQHPNDAAFVDITDLLEDVFTERQMKMKCRRTLTMLEEDSIADRAYNWATRF